MLWEFAQVESKCRKNILVTRRYICFLAKLLKSKLRKFMLLQSYLRFFVGIFFGIANQTIAITNCFPILRPWIFLLPTLMNSLKQIKSLFRKGLNPRAKSLAFMETTNLALRKVEDFKKLIFIRRYWLGYILG